MPDTELTPKELEDLIHAQATEDALDHWTPRTKQETRIRLDAKNLLRLAVRVVNANYGEDRDDAVTELEEFLR